MSLTLTDVRRIAADVVQHENPALEVVGAASAGESNYAEVILTVRGCQVEPCHMVIGLNRDASETECRGAVKASLERHLSDHPPT